MRYIIIDLRQIIDKYHRMSMKTDRAFFSKIPVKRIIEVILSVSPYDYNPEVLYSAIDGELDGNIDFEFLDSFDIFVNTMIEEIDRYISNQIPCSSYTFEEWVSSDGLLIKTQDYLYE